MGRIGLNSQEETLAFGRKMASLLPPNTILALTGELGAGKTTFVKGLALGLNIHEQVQSPTFVLLNAYEGLYHFDLYRMKTDADFTALGFEDYFHQGGICAIEWPERIEKLLPKNTIRIHFSYSEQGRTVTVS